MKELNRDKTKEYNSEPVFYCKHCLSLKVSYISSMEQSEYCEECGSTDIEQSSIEDWIKLFEYKKGFKYVNK